MNAARVGQIVAMFESMAPQDVPRLGQWYAEDASFKDPFNDVSGLPAIQRVYAHMFEAVDTPRFVVTGRLVDGDECVLLWLFHFRTRSTGAQCIRGASHLRLDAGGRIAMHRDYWDAAEELYEKAPLLGALMRWLKKRLRAR